MEKKHLVGVFVLAIIVVFGAAVYIFQNYVFSSKTITRENSIEKEVLGKVTSLDETGIKIAEFTDVPCFRSWDYPTKNLTNAAINQKFNPKNLPWCDDPSGGTLHKPTGNQLDFEYSPKTMFSIIAVDTKGQVETKAVSKDDFIKSVNDPGSYSGSNPEVTITLSGGMVERIDEKYED